MRKRIGFMGFVPSRRWFNQAMPVKICFYHILGGFAINKMIETHEKWVGYDLIEGQTVVELDPDSDVILELSSKNGEITKDEMKCLLHYIVFYMKDYEIISNELVREMTIKIIQKYEHCCLHIKDICKIAKRDVFGGNYSNDFKKVTAFETIGKDGIVYGIYEMKSMGIYIEIPKSASSEDNNNIMIDPVTVDLMKGVSEKDDVAICPTVHFSGSFDDNQIKMTMSHCAELSPAALEGRGNIAVYNKPEGKGAVSRREICAPECEIQKDSVSFYVDGPGFYTVSIKDELCTGKRVALVAFLPLEMPKHRRPVLHVNFYYPFGEFGQRIREEWEKKDNVCVKDETTFILQHIGQDVDVTCEMLSIKRRPGTLKLTQQLETATLEMVPYECLDFELDYTSEDTNEVNLKLRVHQEECRAEIDIKETLKEIIPPPEDPTPIEPTPMEQEPMEQEQMEQEPLEPVPLEPERTPNRVTDQMIDAMSRRKIHADHLSVLVNALGFDTSDFGRFISDNISSTGSRKGYAGTKRLLTRWRNKTDLAHQRPELREALRRATLLDLAKKHLKEKDDFLD